jgi:hypothetical protein
MDCLFMAAGAFDSDKENKLQVSSLSTQRQQKAVQNWEDWTDWGSGICAALPTHPPGHNSLQFLKVLHFVLERTLQFCNPIVSLLTLHDKISCCGCSLKFPPGCMCQ